MTLGRPGQGLALLVAGAFFMENFDGTVIATAAPRMAESFGVAAVDVNAAMTAYLVTLAVVIPAGSRLTDRWGARRVFCAAVAVFTAASGLCALSPDLPTLVLMRVLQGAGGALMVPVGRVAVLRATDRRDLITAIAYLTWPALLAPVLAPAVGGLLSEHLTWRWIFLVNLPLGAVALWLAARLVPSGERPLQPPPMDLPGFVLTGTGLAVLLLGLDRLAGDGSRWAAVGLLASLLLLACAVRRLRRAEHPLLDLGVLRVRGYRAATTGGSAFRMVAGAVPFLLALMFQEAFGWSPLRAGAMVIAVFVGNVAIKPLTTPAMRRFGFRTVLLVSTAGLAATLACCAALTRSAPVWLVAAALLLSGVFRSTGFTAYNSLQLADVGGDRMSDASTLAATTQQLAAGLGVAVGALALRAGAPVAGAFGALGATAPYQAALAVMALLALLSGWPAARLPSAVGAELTSPGRAAGTEGPRTGRDASASAGRE